MTNKKIVGRLSEIYEGKHMVITANHPSLKGLVGKIIDVFLDETNGDKLMFRLQLTPGPFPYDGIENLKSPKHEEVFFADDVKLVDSVFDDKPMVYIVTREWDVSGESGIDITVFANIEKAQIFKNSTIYKESDRDGLIYRLKLYAWKNGKDIREINTNDGGCYICGLEDDNNEYYKITIKEQTVIV